MKRLAAAIVGAAVVFGGIYALAASLSVTSDGLGAGNSVVASCQAAAMNSTYTAPTYSQTASGYQTSTVTVTGLASTCYSKPYKVTLYDGSGASLGEGTGTTPSSGTSFSASITASAANVAGVAVVISG